MSVASFSNKPLEVDKVSTKYRIIKTSIPVPESITEETLLEGIEVLDECIRASI